ncbi:MAG: hypothetical protein MUP44_05125 [Anaerolineales bacterium]|nr:hypothetical protein [Anaerolineales bacterium]
MNSRLIKLMALSAFIIGCNVPTDRVDPTANAHQASTLTPPFSTTESARPTPTDLPPSHTCPVPLGAPILPLLSAPKDWAPDVLTYLNQGGSITAFIEALPALGQSDAQGIAAEIADLNGDRFEDLAITFAQPWEALFPGESAFFIYLCDQENYRLAYASSSFPGADRFHLHQVHDLTGDGIPEILVMQAFCGAHTCFQAWEVIQWQSDHFVNVLEGRSDDLPSPTLEISSPGSDGSMAISITGAGVQSVGAGPSRQLTRTWHWSVPETLFVVVEEQWAAPTFRIHALQDADQAALTGNFDDALGGYNRVIEDPTLDDYPFGEEGHAQLSAYALFRSMLLWTREGDLDQAGSTLNFLREAYSPDNPGGGYRSLAEEFWRAYQSHPDLGYACQIAQAYALEHPGEVLDPLNYGYANKHYDAGDVCPYTA